METGQGGGGALGANHADELTCLAAPWPEALSQSRGGRGPA